MKIEMHDPTWAAYRSVDGITFVRRVGTAWTRKCLSCGQAGAPWACTYRRYEGYCEGCMEGIRVMDAIAR